MVTYPGRFKVAGDLMRGLGPWAGYTGVTVKPSIFWRFLMIAADSSSLCLRR